MRSYSKEEEKKLKVGEKFFLFDSRLILFLEKLKSKWFGPFVITQVSPTRVVTL